LTRRLFLAFDEASASARLHLSFLGFFIQMFNFLPERFFSEPLGVFAVESETLIEVRGRGCPFDGFLRFARSSGTFLNDYS